MLGIQHNPSVMQSRVAFKSNYSDLKYDIESERDEKINQITRDQADWNDFADTLENSDNKVMKKTGKMVRVAATLFGLAATFVGAKYGSKLAIETFKSVANNNTTKSIVDGAKKLKRPMLRTMVHVRRAARNLMAKPAVKNTIDKIAESNIGKKAIDLAKNEKVNKIFEPVKNTLKSVKDIKIDGKKIQSFVENTMAVTTTGSVLVDDLAGRNDGKSTTELAAGV